MSKRKKRGTPGTGLGPWQQHGAMARATRTKTKRQALDRLDRRERQRGGAA